MVNASHAPAGVSKSQTTRHTCHCGKGFLRKEHLRRHQATHQVPSFTCPVCGRSFTRNDVLRRHLGVHNSLNAPLARGWSACDLCHESKTKCDGGQQCSLCTKRGIVCTYSRDSRAPDAEDAVISVGSRKRSSIQPPAAVNRRPTTTAVRTVSSPQSSSSESFSVSPPHSYAAHAPPPSLEARGSVPAEVAVTAVSTAGSAPQSPRLSLRVGLGCLAGLIAAHVSGKSEAEINLPVGYAAWLDTCLDSYFLHFHERWPVIHGPALRDDLESCPLTVAAVAMIGAWLLSGDKTADIILGIHGRLASYALKELIVADIDESSGPKPWPHMAYEVALLNAIFAFESGRRSLLPRARRLLNLTISSMREKGAFNQRQIERHAEVHYPGTFRPWLEHQYTKWKWLAASALKIDVYLALVSSQPPILHAEELQLSMPPTFSLWNAWGLDKYFRRVGIEPTDRSSFSMASMAQSPQVMIPSGTMVEDVIIGLCGSCHDIWKLAQVQWSGGFVPQCDSGRAWLSEPLQSWKDRLEGIASLWADPVGNAPEIRRLLAAYMGRETEAQPGWEQAVMNRITLFVLNGRMLYHLLLLHLNINVRFMTILVFGSWSLAGAGGASACSPVTPVDADIVQLCRWAVTEDARKAILHCLAILKAYECALYTVNGPPGNIDPIAHVALSTAAAVLKGWFLTDAVPCTCGVVSRSPIDNMDIDVSAISESCGWVANGGCVAVDGIPVCACASDAWMSRFATTLRRQARGWQLAEFLAARLQTTPLDAAR
ncbi:Fungal Zn(2)-Cys(6) binuclear cluster domain [Geosmithia morbida]|uniref:Fungal Zn(2)-Cys(6) binuclear cluster domain n=1 Tax=Geosmithia morbida TaxID=1094350 RepID=A0A9P5CZV2_9HYPO|nr:Fungal Zn(2)-Cys(6) binuclear cluster domain [Geosmithia morbida]KAF4122013.1 Fungal Zn(2)-Cys(6) binuclear cluster domain [Geosmithia morbida]